MDVPIPRFHTPEVHDNAGGWGPCDMPEQFKDMPYQPFSKGDRLGKVNSPIAGVTFWSFF